MDKNELAMISEVNGFEVRLNDRPMTSEPYRVFHPSFEGVFIADFSTIKDAEKFCKTEDTGEWATELLKS